MRPWAPYVSLAPESGIPFPALPPFAVPMCLTFQALNRRSLGLWKHYQRRPQDVLSLGWLKEFSSSFLSISQQVWEFYSISPQAFILFTHWLKGFILPPRMKWKFYSSHFQGRFNSSWNQTLYSPLTSFCFPLFIVHNLSSLLFVVVGCWFFVHITGIWTICSAWGMRPPTESPCSSVIFTVFQQSGELLHQPGPSGWLTDHIA